MVNIRFMVLLSFLLSEFTLDQPSDSFWLIKGHEVTGVFYGVELESALFGIEP